MSAANQGHPSLPPAPQALPGNILLGGIIGMGVDAATGAALDRKPNPVIVHAAARNKPPPPPATCCQAAQEACADVVRLVRLLRRVVLESQEPHL